MLRLENLSEVASLQIEFQGFTIRLKQEAWKVVVYNKQVLT